MSKKKNVNRFEKELVKYTNTLNSEDDSLMVIANNNKTGELIMGSFGKWEDISLILSNKDVVNHTEESITTYAEIKSLVLNTALNICNEDKNIRTMFKKGIKAMGNK